MQIHLQIHSPSLQLETLLGSAALPELMELIQRHRLEEPEIGLRGLRGPGRRGPRGRNNLPREEIVVELDAPALATRERISALSVKDLFYNQASPQTFAEKFLVLAAWHEAVAVRDKAKAHVHGRVLIRALVDLGETPPANPPRDVQQAIAQGWLARGHHRRLLVTNAGWRHLGDLLSDEGEESVLV